MLKKSSFMENESSHGKALAEIGGRFHRYFKRKGLTGQEVAKRMEVHPNKLSSMLNGTDYNLRVILLIAQHFPALNIQWLITGEGEFEPDALQRYQISFRQTEWKQALAQIEKNGSTLLDKEAKKKVKELAPLLDEAILIRSLLVAHLSDIQADYIEASNHVRL